MFIPCHHDTLDNIHSFTRKKDLDHVISNYLKRESREIVILKNKISKMILFFKN